MTPDGRETLRFSVTSATKTSAAPHGVTLINNAASHDGATSLDNAALQFFVGLRDGVLRYSGASFRDDRYLILVNVQDEGGK